VIGVDTIYVIQQENKNINININENDKYTTESCIMLIFIRDKMFIHYYAEQAYLFAAKANNIATTT
jgi:hypothetical protein